MAKVTSKLQVTVPKSIAQRYGIKPGDEISWVEAGESIRVVPARAVAPALDMESRLRLFDAATERQRARTAAARFPKKAKDRGWTRRDLYDRGHAR